MNKPRIEEKNGIATVIGKDGEKLKEFTTRDHGKSYLSAAQLWLQQNYDKCMQEENLGEMKKPSKDTYRKAVDYDERMTRPASAYAERGAKEHGEKFGKELGFTRPWDFKRKKDLDEGFKERIGGMIRRRQGLTLGQTRRDYASDKLADAERDGKPRNAARYQKWINMDRKRYGSHTPPRPDWKNEDLSEELETLQEMDNTPYGGAGSRADAAQYNKAKEKADARFRKQKALERKLERKSSTKKSSSEASTRKLKEEDENLQELSNKTLGSYVKLAARDAANSEREYEDNHRSEFSSERKHAYRHAARAEKRLKGIARATDKLAKEGWHNNSEDEGARRDALDEGGFWLGYGLAKGLSALGVSKGAAAAGAGALAAGAYGVHKVKEYLRKKKEAQGFADRKQQGIEKAKATRAAKKAALNNPPPQMPPQDKELKETSNLTIANYLPRATADIKRRREAGRETQADMNRAAEDEGIPAQFGIPFDPKLHGKHSRQKSVDLAIKKLTGKAKVPANEEIEHLDELKKDDGIISRYKTKAAASAKAADEQGNFEKGNKRFSGVVLATKKQLGHGVKVPATLEERPLTPAEKKKKEEIIMAMKEKGEPKYGAATAIAKRVAENNLYDNILTKLEEGRGRPPKPGSEAWKRRQSAEAEGKTQVEVPHIATQLMKHADYGFRNHTYKFSDGSTHEITPNQRDTVLRKLRSMTGPGKNPDDREKMYDEINTPKGFFHHTGDKPIPSMKLHPMSAQKK